MRWGTVLENYIQNDEYNSVFVTFCTLDLTNVGVQRGRNYPDCERITVKGCFAWYSAGVYDVGGETEPARSHHPAACAKAEVGLVLFVLIETLGPVSGCHLNPTVTIAMLFTKNMKTKDGIQYIVVQLVGGFLGVIAGHAMFIGNDFFQWLTISEATRNGGAFWAEFVGTFMLVLVIFGTMRHNSSQPGLIIGFLVGGFLITTSSTDLCSNHRCANCLQGRRKRFLGRGSCMGLQTNKNTFW